MGRDYLYWRGCFIDDVTVINHTTRIKEHFAKRVLLLVYNMLARLLVCLLFVMVGVE